MSKKKVETINCLDHFLALFRGTSLERQTEDLIEYMIKSTYFIHPDMVTKRNKIISEMIKSDVKIDSNEEFYNVDKVLTRGNERVSITIYRKKKNSFERVRDNLIPVRWSSAQEVFEFVNGQYQRVAKEHIDSKNKAVKYQKTHTLYYRINYKGSEKYIPVEIDGDGNQCVVDIIKELTGHTVSKGKKSTIKNATISHVWSNATDPLYFTGLWNVLIVPTFCNFILDKEGNDNVPTGESFVYEFVINKVNKTFQALCFLLYKIDEISYLKDTGIISNLSIEEEYCKLAEKYIKLIPKDHLLNIEESF